ncbi:ARID DNA-binding domain-containing protein [Tanacetum coccineum]
MVNTNTSLESKWQRRNLDQGHNKQWYQSKNHGKTPRKTSQIEFLQRQIKREKEGRVERCAKQITRDCKNMLKKRMEEIEAYNHSISNNKFKEYTCFYCNQIGHVAKNCSTKAEDNKEGSAYVNTIIRAKIIQNKSLVVCFKCKRIGHFANLCPTKGNQTPIEETVEPIVSVKYPEFIHFKTRGIIKGTNLGTWDDYWYVSNTTDKHLTSNTKFFANLKEEFIVEKLESQKKLLFTYGIGEVLLTSGNTEYLIPGVYYAPEVSLNILSQNLLRQQGFEILYEEGGYILEYMFRNLQGKNIDENKMRQRHNNFLDDRFDL